MDYFSKYLKYKTKYLNIKNNQNDINTIGGSYAKPDFPDINFMNLLLDDINYQEHTYIDNQYGRYKLVPNVEYIKKYFMTPLYNAFVKFQFSILTQKKTIIEKINGLKNIIIEIQKLEDSIKKRSVLTEAFKNELEKLNIQKENNIKLSSDYKHKLQKIYEFKNNDEYIII